MALLSLASTLLVSGLPTLPDCTHELCPSTKYENDAPSPVECEAEVGELQPEYFRTLGSWQKRYGRDNLALSRHFRDEIYQLQIEPRLGQALNLCPAAVLEIMMNCILAIETENGREAAREFLLYIYQLREELFAKLPDDHRKEQLEKLMLEWNADIAYVYPKFLDVQRLGPNSALSDEQDMEEVCLGQRFFVYDLPKNFYGGTFECLQGQWGTEVLLHQYFRHNCKTADPDAADWFYVPLHATCLYVKLNENVSEDLILNMDEVSNRFIFDPMMDLLRKSRYFHRLNGADHIFLFADGQGPRIWDSYDLLRSSAVFLSPESRCPTWGEPLRRYVDVKHCLSSWKDLVIPGHTDYARIQYMKRHNKRSAERRLLLTFHGRAPLIHEAYGDCAVRGELMKLSRTRNLQDGVDIGGFVGDYLERKGDSHFCLVPAGTSPWTNHLYESFYAGCIPVILSDEYELAFMNDLPWENFSIKWPESRICDDEDCSRSALYDYLLSLVEEPQKLWHMKHQLELHSCFFNWYSTDLSCSLFALLHQHLTSLWDRRQPSPLLITKDAVMAMKPGSVIVDLAAIGGGNCELTKLNETYTTDNGVTIIGFANLPARMAEQASAMYAQNMANLLRHVHAKGKAAAFIPNLYGALDQGEEGDIVSRSIVCCKSGNPVAMPPPPQPTPIKPKPVSAQEQAKKTANPFNTALISATVLTFTCCCMVGLGEGVSTSLLSTFLLAGAAGYQAVWGVAHALHTPLMSVTNAISGMTAIGGLLLLDRSSSWFAQFLALIAVLVSAVNIIGGFVVSQRMLNLFKKEGEKDYSPFMLLPGLVFLIVCLTKPELLKAVSTVSALLCIAAIGGLATMSTANSGCKFGMVGVFGAMAAAMVSLNKGSFLVSSVLLLVGGGAGLVLGVQVSPIALPQTVAAFHSLVGLAAMCTSIGSFVETPEAGANMENIAAVLGDFIGGITLTGSLIAFGKLNGNLASKPLDLPGKNFLNLGGLFLFLFFMFKFLGTSGPGGVVILWLVAALACVMGVHLVGSVGGGDMPVCITVLNSYSGWALVAEGFLLKSPVLTIVGSLIGFSGAILTKIMCDAMNRDIMNVLFGGLNNAPVAKGNDTGPKEHVETSVAAVAEMLASAKEVLVVPGYGMAMARAQTAMGELASTLRANNIKLKFGVHPVAGRMPGQMNVLLAEAGVPHEWVLEMDEVNPDMENQDVVLVVGANDVVNSAAQELEGCAIWGMPVIEVWRSKKVIFCKRSMGGGYADLDNPVFYKENTEMLLGDAKKTSDSLAAMVKERLEKV